MLFSSRLVGETVGIVLLLLGRARRIFNSFWHGTQTDEAAAAAEAAIVRNGILLILINFYSDRKSDLFCSTKRLTCNLNCGGKIRLEPTGALGRFSSTLPTGSSGAPWAMFAANVENIGSPKSRTTETRTMHAWIPSFGRHDRRRRWC